MSNIVITGATSLIGVALTELCLASGHKVTAVTRPNSTNLFELPRSNRLLICECNIESIEQLPFILQDKHDIFFHLAWLGTSREDRSDFIVQQKNIAITIKAVEVAKKLSCNRFIATGSQAEYGPQNIDFSPATLPCPKDPYGASKLAAGHLSRIMAEKLDIEHIWARIFSVYGPHDNKDTLITTLIKKLRKGEVLHLTKCEQKWDYLYVSDAALALLLLAQSGISGETYCVGSGQTLPLKYYVDTLVSYLNPTQSPQYGDIPYSSNQVMYLKANIDNLTRDTGFLPRISFEDGIRQTVRWVEPCGDV